MKKFKIGSILLIGLLTFLPLISVAQSIDKESTYKLSGKARRGKLAHVEQADNGDYKLYYITKAKAKKAKVQVYTFDKDFNFKDLSAEEILFEKMKLKFSWFKFNGELYTVEGITMNWNPVVALKLKKKRITYKYDWLLLGYYKTVEVLEKVKPRTDDGMKYYAFKHFEDEITGDLYIVAGAAPGGMSKDAGNRLTDIRLLKFDSDLNKVAETKVPFEFGQAVAFAQGFGVPDPENSTALGIDGGVIVFAPTEWKGSSAPVDKGKGNFTYVQFDKDLKIKRESFVSPSPGWAMEGASWLVKPDGTKDVYIYGAAALGKDKFHAIAVQSAKKKSIQILKVNSGKIDYLTETSLDDIESAKKMPSSNKKTASYTGKQKLNFQFTDLKNGNIILFSQYYGKDGMPSDYTALEYDQTGKLVANYMRNMALKPQSAKGSGNHLILENNNGVYWIAYEIDEGKGIPGAAPVISKINVGNNTIGDPIVLGKEGKKPTYFVDNSFPLLNISNTQQVYFGSDKSGKNIWFCRVNLD